MTLIYLLIYIFKLLSQSKIPPWKLLKHEIDSSLSENTKTETNPLVLKQKFDEFKNFRRTRIDIYTDDSIDKKKVAAAAVIDKNVFSARLTD